MKKFRKMLIAACLSMTALTACGNDGGGSETPTDSTTESDTIKIGLHYELSGSTADYGNAELKGSQLAIAQANERLGEEVYVDVTYDNRGDPAEAVTLAARLAEDGVAGVVGPATSGASTATYQTSNDNQVVVISPSATANNQTLVDPSNPESDVYDYVFRVCFEDTYQGAAMAQFAFDNLGASKAIVYGDTSSEYGKGLMDAFSEHFTSLGGEVVDTMSYVAGETEFSSVLTNIAAQDFDVLYIAGYYSEAGLIIKQARAAGIDCPILGPDGFESTTLSDLAGVENLNDVYFTTAYTTVGASDELQAFIDAYKAEYNEDPNMFSALAYDSTNLLIQAIEEAGTTDPETLKQTLENIEFDGITGSFVFDETHTPVKPVLVVEFVDGVQTNAISVNPSLDE